MKWTSSWLRSGSEVVFVVALWASLANGENVVSLRELTETASKESEEIRSVELSLEATISEIEGRDFELSPRLTSELAQVEDRRATFSPGRRSLSRFLDLNLTKPFSTGTTVGLRTGYEVADVASAGSRHIANWELSLSQSLWRNAFGRSVGLRRDADAAELKSRRFELLLRKQQFLTTLESTYWDLTAALKERAVREDNLDRSEKLHSWVRDRLRRSAAEPSDVFQIQALIESRRLELLDVKNRIEAASNRLAQIVPTWKSTSVPDTQSLEVDREINGLLADPRKAGKKPTRIDSLAGKHRVEQARALAEREGDSLSPQLDVAVTHGRNGIENNFNSAWGSALGPNSTYTKFGVLFAMDLDPGTKDARRRALLLQAEAREMDARRLARESDIGWEELERNIALLKSRSETARLVAASQLKKSQEERKRYEQGRSTAFQLITFENDSALSRIEIYRLLADLRKAEAQVHLFTGAEEKSE